VQSVVVPRRLYLTFGWNLGASAVVLPRGQLGNSKETGLVLARRPVFLVQVHMKLQEAERLSRPGQAAALSGVVSTADYEYTKVKGRHAMLEGRQKWQNFRAMLLELELIQLSILSRFLLDHGHG